MFLTIKHNRNTNNIEDYIDNEAAGTEIDIRYLSNTGISLSHDVISSSRPLMLKDLLEKYPTLGKEKILAINIKEAGLSELLKIELMKNNITNYFCFDMSMPDTRHYQKSGVKYLLRYSEYEQIDVKSDIFKDCFGVWVDSFCNTKEIIYNNDLFLKLIENQKKIVFVSPELHSYGQDTSVRNQIWTEIKHITVSNKWTENVFICTDYPQEFSKI